MKIYTEIVYKWDEEKGELVEESSKSFEYEGPVSQCHRKAYPHPHGGIAGDIYQAGTDIGEGAVDIIEDVTGAAGDTATGVTNTITKTGEKAWSEMTTYAGDIWEKGGAAVTDIWQGTGMEEMAAKWTDPEAMKQAWSSSMPWDAASSFQSRYMMGFDMLKSMEGFSFMDFNEFRQNLSEEFTRWESAANTNIASGNEGIENIIDENTDSLNDLESGINTTVSDTVELGEAGVENIAIGADALQQGVDLAGEGTSVVLDSTINPNNPNALFVSPQNWYEEAAGVGKGGFDFMPGGSLGVTEESAAASTASVVGPLAEQGYNDFGTIVNQQYGGEEGDSIWGTMDSVTTGASTSIVNYLEAISPYGRPQASSLKGDPFGRQGNTRRLIHQKRDFKNVAQSKINAGGYS